jgi:hypothetical protein
MRILGIPVRIYVVLCGVLEVLTVLLALTSVITLTNALINGVGLLIAAGLVWRWRNAPQSSSNG